jgi:hypothetical protein
MATTTTIQRINELSAERGRLFSQAGNGRRGDPAVMLRIKEIGQEMDRLWAVRRAELTSRREGIDAVVDQAYQAAYGPDYEEAVFPTPVVEPESERQAARLAA